MIAHRGESRDAPENTLASIQLAWDRGAQAVELDVRQSVDGQVMVIHDADLWRVGRSRLSISRSTADALRAIDIGSWKHRRWAGERVPLLAEVLAAVPRGGCLFVEIKDGPEIVPALADSMERCRLDPQQIVFMSFYPSTIGRVAAELPSCEACLLLAARQWRAKGGLAKGIAAARRLGCTSLDLQVHRSLDRSVVEIVHAARMRLYVWTVNRVSTARRLARAGVDGITTDRCAWLRHELNERA